MVAEARQVIRQSVVAVPAVLGPVAVINLAVVVGVFGVFQEFFHQVDRIVQVIVVHVANIDVNFALELGAESFPVALQDVAQVVVLAPVGRRVGINFAGQLVPDAPRVAVRSDRRENCFPDVVLVARARSGAEGQLAVVGLFHGATHLTQPVAAAGARRALPARFNVIGIFMLINIDDGVGAKIYRVGAGGPAAVVHIGVENLRGQSFPAARRAAIGEAGPAFAKAAEFFLNVRDELIIDGIAVGAEVSRVDRVGIIVIGIGVLDFNDEEARRVGSRPVFIKIVGFLLDDAVVTVKVKTLAVVGRKVGGGWLFPEAAEVVRKMPVKNYQRITCFGMLIKAVRQKDVGAEVNGRSPEVSEQLALNADVFDVFCFRWVGNRRDDLVKGNFDGFGAGRVYAHFDGLAVEIAWLAVPLLTFAAVGRKLEDAAVGQMERLVDVKQGLNPVFAGFYVGKAAPRIAEGSMVNDGRSAGRQPIDIKAEDLLGGRAVADLEARLLVVIRRNQQEQATIKRGAGPFGRKGHGKFKLGLLGAAVAGSLLITARRSKEQERDSQQHGERNINKRKTETMADKTTLAFISK